MLGDRGGGADLEVPGVLVLELDVEADRPEEGQRDGALVGLLGVLVGGADPERAARVAQADAGRDDQGFGVRLELAGEVLGGPDPGERGEPVVAAAARVIPAP